jgi:ectoine hydroxylase-related dioxygenase (phytanoyl-CoA dioxygenase family)
MPAASFTGSARPASDVVSISAAVHADGIAGVSGAFPPEWADRVRADFEAAFAQARTRPRGTVDRGPNRYYFAVHPQQLSGFVDLVTHPVVMALSEHVCGADYQVVELGFDVPLPGAVDQPWHRDFPADAQTRAGRLTSLAFNLTTVDVTPDMGPFEIAPGTQWDDGDAWPYGMFPPDPTRYDELAQQRCPRRGDMSVRTGLAVHRGTANRSGTARAVLILGVATADTDTAQVHQLHMTREYFEALPEAVRRALRCTLVDELRPIEQRHDIEGLMMGGAPAELGIPPQRGPR